jgi:hypothetical protein
MHSCWQISGNGDGVFMRKILQNVHGLVVGWPAVMQFCSKLPDGNVGTHGPLQYVHGTWKF